jgi:hypothetical protein
MVFVLKSTGNDKHSTLRTQQVPCNYRLLHSLFTTHHLLFLPLQKLLYRILKHTLSFLYFFRILRLCYRIIVDCLGIGNRFSKTASLLFLQVARYNLAHIRVAGHHVFFTVLFKHKLFAPIWPFNALVTMLLFVRAIVTGIL